MTTRTVAEHLQHVRQLLAHLHDREPQSDLLLSALGRTLADDVYSPLDLPVFRNSAMDGYAARASSLVGVPVTLTVAGTIAAGDSGQEPLPEDAVMKIMTGAPLPTGADCVVPIEHTDGGVVTVTIGHARAVGDFVREPGTDVTRGELLLTAGTVLAARHIAALAAIGLETIPVRRRVKAAVITTGDELVAAGSALAPGQIYNCNGPALAAALTADAAEVVLSAHSEDKQSEFRRLLEVAIRDVGAEVVFTSGGVSMGDFEVVKETLEPLGGDFGHVAVQPGGPQGTTVVNGVPVLSFPGNPVSVMVSFEIFARPVLRELAGLPPIEPQSLPLSVDLRSPRGKRQFLRGRRVPGGVELVSGPGSHLIATMAGADVLIDIAEEVTSVAAGTDVRVWAL